ncbi:porin family protein [Lujinxingia vulgaris]|uniref:Porin family protein n=1 Tax=Lujinxingia vulgaris TaxID=2600176 RepID=A0A5C6XFJ6_9DELT|nr:porin family protein [Lujinxingia vulgaris]TXD35925.1 porin family protein [Lujinxingia vulgaris]
MNATLLKPMTFALALLLSVPLAQMSVVGDAQAGPGSILSESRDEDAPRGHKMQRRDRSERSESRSDRRRSRDDRSERRSDRSERRTTRTTRPRRTTSPRPSAVRPGARPVGQPRVVTRPGTTRTTRTHVRTRHNTSVRSTTHIHHTSTSDNHYNEPASPRSPSASPLDGYLTLGLGMGGFDANQISTNALPGNEFNLGLGVRGELLGFELGFHAGGYTFNPEVSGTDIAVMGLSGDLKLQPSLGIFMPYVMAGLGGYHFQDAHLQETAVGGAVRLGGGLDLRFNSFGLGLRYLYNVYGFGNDLSFSDGLSARSESIGLNASFYF